VAIVGAAALAVVASGGVARATTKIIVDAGWQSFITGGGVDGASIARPWVFTSTSVAKVTVTDAFCHVDEFRVYDKDILLGDTSEVASEFPACRSSCFPASIQHGPRRTYVSRARPTGNGRCTPWAIIRPSARLAICIERAGKPHSSATCGLR
jgi:hypothetical protein